MKSRVSTATLKGPLEDAGTAWHSLHIYKTLLSGKTSCIPVFTPSGSAPVHLQE